MAQLPQISPEPVGIGFSAGRVPNNPIPEAMGHLGRTASSTVMELGDLMMRQHQVNQDRKGFQEFYDGHTQLEDSVATEIDPKIRLDKYREGMNDLMSNIRQNHPDMSEETLFQIHKYADTGIHRQTIETLKAQEKINKTDLASDLASTVPRAVEAKTNEDARMILADTFMTLDKHVGLGTLTQKEADNIKHDLPYKVSLGRFQSLARTDPEAVFKIKPGESMLHPQDEFKIKQEAMSTIKHNEAMGTLYIDQRKRQGMIDAYSGRYKGNPQKAWDDLKAGFITQQQFEVGTGQRPTNPKQKQAYLDALDNSDWGGDAEALKHFGMEARENPNMSPEDYQDVSRHLHEKEVSFKDEQGKHGELLGSAFQSDIDEHLTAMGGLGDKKKVKLLSDLKKELTINLKHAKNPAEQSKIAEEFNKRKDAIIKPEGALKISPNSRINPMIIKNTDAMLNDESGNVPAQEGGK